MNKEMKETYKKVIRLSYHEYINPVTGECNAENLANNIFYLFRFVDSVADIYAVVNEVMQEPLP